MGDILTESDDPDSLYDQQRLIDEWLALDVYMLTDEKLRTLLLDIRETELNDLQGGNKGGKTLSRVQSMALEVSDHLGAIPPHQYPLVDAIYDLRKRSRLVDTTFEQRQKARAKEDELEKVIKSMGAQPLTPKRTWRN